MHLFIRATIVAILLRIIKLSMFFSISLTSPRIMYVPCAHDVANLNTDADQRDVNEFTERFGVVFLHVARRSIRAVSAGGDRGQSLVFITAFQYIDHCGITTLFNIMF